MRNKKHDQENFVKIFRSGTIDGMDSPENSFPKRTSAQTQAVSKLLHRVIIKFLLVILLVGIKSFNLELFARADDSKALIVRKCPDFKVTGDGSAENWALAEWMVLPQRILSGEPLTTKVKVLYSKTGIYFLFNCRDKKLTSTMNADFMDLWKEDVVEIFLWTDDQTPVYFEYEISPLNYELPILISNEKGDLVRWMPFHYDSDRKTRHATTVQGGEMRSNAAITGWTAEFFIPYKLLRPLNNSLPKPDTRWRANFYRIDYDSGISEWSWQLTSKTFHDFEKFGFLVFE
ncbi:hypothetical protein AQPE_4395 [Aquipluma nitroreducens]|uniref:Carbohydrate-binding domain-containing protein n=1 Tax=Aquipluma nitroreducens TaxID=2010828 RepID=A0A5K7SG63_9BACT|nr:carbohydrate-binding family 9-like protein [Aquipluma nitroreducens]BBE20204.1 hypothetical protein AQPE_4395 [Aquipluma nitroreducens]